MTKPVAQAPVRSASPARSRKLEVIEPFHIVRTRRIRNERMRRLALGLAFGLVVFAGLGGLMGCAETRLGPPEAYTLGGDARYDEAGLTTADFNGVVKTAIRSPGEVEKTCRRFSGNSGAAACSARHADGSCSILISAPLDGDDLDFFRRYRHELLHCKYGDWHD